MSSKREDSWPWCHPFKGKALILPSGTFSTYPGPYKPLPRSVLPGWTMLPVHGLAKGQLFAGGLTEPGYRAGSTACL